MTAKYQLYKDKQGKFRFRLIAENGRTVASGEAYEKHTNCLNGIGSVKRNSNAAIEDTTTEGAKIPFPKYQVYVDKAGEFRFNLSASNGEVIASSEGYSSMDNCLKGIATVQRISNSEIEDLTIDQKPLETAVSENPEVALKMEEKVEPPLIVAQAATVQEIDNSRNEAPSVKPKANSSKQMLAIVGLAIGIVLLAVGVAILGAVLGPLDMTLGAVILLAGSIAIGIGIILFVTKNR